MRAKITSMSMKINDLLGQDFLHKLSLSSGFIERSSSRLTGQSFAMLTLLHCPNAAGTSLQDMCDTLETEYDIKISKQSLDERFNTYAVTFFKSIYNHVVKELVNKVSDWKQDCNFRHISIMDCTGFKLPDRLAIFYPGSGTKSAIKIGYDFDILKQAFTDLTIKAGNESDISFLKDIESRIQANSLYIKDLGFYKRDHFIKIHNSGGFFLSRCKSTSCFYIVNPKGKPQSVALSDLLKGVNTKVEKKVYIDNACKVEVRLLIEPVPEEVAQKRRIKASQKTKSNGYKIGSKTLEACSFTVLVTNAPQNILLAHLASEIYFLRWQIEIIFKTWKSLLCIDKLKPMSIFRFECYLYCKLIHVVICMLLSNLAQARLGMVEEISIWKATKLYVKKIDQIEKALIKGLTTLTSFFNRLVLNISKNCLKSAKKIDNNAYKRRPYEVIILLSKPLA